MTTSQDKSKDFWSRFYCGYKKGTKTKTSIIVTLDNSSNTPKGEWITIGK